MQVWNALAEQDKLRFQQEIAQYSPPPEVCADCSN